MRYDTAGQDELDHFHDPTQPWQPSGILSRAEAGDVAGRGRKARRENLKHAARGSSSCLEAAEKIDGRDFALGADIR